MSGLGAIGVKASVQESIRDTLRDHIASNLTSLGQRQRPNFVFTGDDPSANKTPVVCIFDNGGSQQDMSGYVFRKLPFRLLVVVTERTSALAAQAAMEYLDAVRATLETYYTLDGDVVNVEIKDEMETGEPIEIAGGVLQANGLNIEVWVGHARGATTL